MAPSSTGIPSIVGDSLVVRLTSFSGLEVLSSEDVRRLADLDASRQTLGCDEASCLAELASALGAEVIVYGSIGTLGRIVVVNLSIFDSKSAKSVARETVQAHTLEELPQLVDGAVNKLVARIPGVATTQPGPPPRSLPVLPAVGAVVGVVGVVVGATLAELAWATYVDAALPATQRTEAQGVVVVGLAIAIPSVVVTGLSVTGLALALTE